MMFLWLPLLVLVPLLFVWTTRPEAIMAGHATPASSGRDEAFEIVRQRLARGEITVAQYEEMLRTLGK